MVGSDFDPVCSAMSRLVSGPVTRHRLIRGSGRRLSWLETGPAAGLPVVLVAGAGEVGLDWAFVIPALAGRFRVVAYDRAGLGASDRDPRLTTASQVDDLTALLDVVGPALLVGHSWGGLLAELATVARPDRVLGLVLVDPFHEDMRAAVPPVLRVASNLILTGVVGVKVVGLFPRVARAMGRRLAERCTDDPAVRALIVDAYVASYATFGQVATIGAENRLAGAVRDVRTAGAVPDVPMRVLTATRGKPAGLQQLTGVLGERTAAGFRRGEHVAVAGSGHYIHRDQPGTVVAAVVAVAAAAGSPDRNPGAGVDDVLVEDGAGGGQPGPQTAPAAGGDGPGAPVAGA